MKQKKKLFKELELHKKTTQETTFCQQTIETIAKHFGLEEDFINKGTRKREYVYARQICMTLIKKHTRLSLGRIGELIGDKDHATVIHAIKTISNLIDIDKQIKTEIYDIERLIICKMKVLENKKTDNDSFYYVNFDNYESIRFSDNKGIVFTGFNSSEILKILDALEVKFEETRKHENTGFYILEK